VVAILTVDAGTRAQRPSVQLWIASSEEAGVIAGLEERASLSLRPNPDDGVESIAVDQSEVYQRMEGRSAAFTDGAAWLINRKLSAARSDPVLLRLFDWRAGIGLSFLRNPIGSSHLTRGC